MLSDEDRVLAATRDGHHLTLLQLFAQHFARVPGVFIVFQAQLPVGAHAPTEAIAAVSDGKGHGRAAGDLDAFLAFQRPDYLYGLRGVGLALVSQTEATVFNSTQSVYSANGIECKRVVLAGHDLRPASAVDCSLCQSFGLGQCEKDFALGYSKLKFGMEMCKFGLKMCKF